MISSREPTERVCPWAGCVQRDLLMTLSPMRVNTLGAVIKRVVVYGLRLPNELEELNY